MMSCCIGTGQTTKFTGSLLWREKPDIERKLNITASGSDGQWEGEASGFFDMGDPLVFSCGERSVKGSAVPLRVRMTLNCTETATKTYINGMLTITFAGNTYKIRLVAMELSCASPPIGSVEWPQLFLGQLGSGSLSLVGS